MASGLFKFNPFASKPTGHFRGIGMPDVDTPLVMARNNIWWHLSRL